MCLVYNSDPLEVCILQPWALDADIAESLCLLCVLFQMLKLPARHDISSVCRLASEDFEGEKKWMLIANFMSNVKAEGLECAEKNVRNPLC